MILKAFYSKYLKQLPFGLILLLSACTGSKSYQVGSANYFKLPLYDAMSSEYKFQVVELNDLNNLSEFDGRFARFYISPTSQNSHLMGARPLTHFIKTKKYFVPANDISLQVATIYSHIQNLYKFDQKIGVEQLNKLPRDIGIAVNVKSGGQLVDNNAFYDGDLDAFLFVPYTDKNLPININGGIIAHEHFHSLFYKTVFQSLVESGKFPSGIQPTAHDSDKIYSYFDFKKLKLDIQTVADASDNEAQINSWYNQLIIRGLNEGLADFWAWLYTDDVNFISYSLPFLKKERSLSGKLEDKYTNPAMLKSEVTNRLFNSPEIFNKFLNQKIYEIGTYYSRALKELTTDLMVNRNISSDDAKILIAKMIMRSFNPLIKTFQNNTSADYYDLNDYIISLYEILPNKLDTDCELFVSKLNRTSASKFSCQFKDGENKIVKEPGKPTAVDGKLINKDGDTI